MPTIEALAAAFIAPFEVPGGKPILAAYPDIAGVWTIGYGTTCVDGETVEKGLMLTPEECLAAFAKDIAETVYAVVIANLHHPWSNNEIVALSSLAYNIGREAYRTSSVLRFHNVGNTQLAAVSFSMWDMAHVDGALVVVPGLLDRRHAEAAKYLS